MGHTTKGSSLGSLLTIQCNGHKTFNEYVSLRLRVQNAGPAEPCVGKY